MKTKLFALILMSVLILLSLVPAVHAETWTEHNIEPSWAGTPRYPVIYDIDNDGNPDVVVASRYWGRTYWYKAPADPTGAWNRSTIGTGLEEAHGVFVHDMDGDGDPDVVVSGYIADKVVLYACPNDIAARSGTWSNYTIAEAEAANGVKPVYVDDIDEDGNPDVVAAVYDDGDVVWYEAPDNPNQTWPSESKHVIDSNLPSAKGIRVADMDGDGDPDVVAAAETGKVVLYACPNDIAARSGTWLNYTIDSVLYGATSVDVADIDGDGHPDVVATGQYVDKVVWYEAPDNPNQTWPSGSEHVIDDALDAAWGVHIYSIDGWSTLDVVASAYFADVVVWYQGPENPTTAGEWTKTTIDAFADGAVGVDVYDIDGDLDPDVVAACEAAGLNDVVWYKSDWPVWPIPEVPVGTILLLGTGLLIPVAFAATKRLRLNHRLKN